MEATRNLCAQIPISLHDRVREERESLGQSLSEPTGAGNARPNGNPK